MPSRLKKQNSPRPRAGLQRYNPAVRPGPYRALPGNAERIIGQPVHEIPVTGSTYLSGGEAPAVVSGAWTEQRSSAALWAFILIFLSSSIWALSFVIGFQNALAIQMGLGLLAAIVGLAVPSLGVMGIGMLCALDGIAVELLLTGGLLRFNTVNYLLLIVMVIALPFLLRLRDTNSRALQIFILLLGLELIFSKDIPEGVQDVLNLVTTFGILVYFARSLKDGQALYWLGIVNGIFAGLGGLVFLLQMAELPYANPNNWTYFQITALFSICVAFTYAHRHHKNKLFLLILAVVNFMWVFLSASRGSLLIALLCGLYLFLSTRSFTISTLMVAAAALIGLWIGSQFAQQQLYTISRIQLLFDTSQSAQRRTSERSVLAKAGVDLFLEHPFGVGTGSFDRMVGSSSLQVRNRPAHSGWIKTLAENGIPGILLMVVFISSFAVVGFRKRRQDLLLFGVFVTLVLAFAFISKEFQGKSLWFLTAAGIALLNAEEVLAFANRKSRAESLDIRGKLREVRYGRRQ